MMPFYLKEHSYYFANASWLPWVFIAWLTIAVLAIFAYRRSPLSLGKKIIAIGLRLLGISLLLLCLLEPMATFEIAKPQANSFAVLLDKSQSVGELSKISTGSGLRDYLKNCSSWAVKLSNNFRVRRYVAGENLQPVDSFEAVEFDSKESAIVRALQSIRDRMPYRTSASDSESNLDSSTNAAPPVFPPLAGILLLSDGQATDRDTLERLNQFPIPIYPVTKGRDLLVHDLAIESVVAQQSDFETAPVTLACTLVHSGFDNREVRVELLGKQLELIEQQVVPLKGGGQSTRVEFRFRPKEFGVQGYTLRALPNESKSGDGTEKGLEATLLNNSRHLVIERRRGPHPVLYVAGRPNWEFKFLSRALHEDEEIELHGLIRIARKEAKFSFRNNAAGDSNSLFSGFEDITEEEKEHYDEPVYVRLGDRKEGAQSKGFPADLQELFGYKAIILDDVGEDLLTPEQQRMLSQFVRARGGGLLMLGGTESMRGEGFNASPIGQLAPVYGEQKREELGVESVRFIPADSQPSNEHYTTDPNRESIDLVRLELTRDGWLQPFMRLGDSEAKERIRLQSAPASQVWNQVGGVKPGASVLAVGKLEADALGEEDLDRSNTDEADADVPILVTQRFGRGRTAAFLVGDWWRWAMNREGSEPSPVYQAWRQLVRWTMTDVPDFNEFTSRPVEEFSHARILQIDLRTRLFEPIEGASVDVTLTDPAGETIKLAAEESSEAAGRYEATALCKRDGIYRATAVCNLPDGQNSLELETGWAYEPLIEEFRGIGEDTDVLEQIAKKSGGRLVSWDELNSFVENVPSGSTAVKEVVVYPLWHQGWVLALAIGCLCLEWGWRRRYGMA